MLDSSTTSSPSASTAQRIRSSALRGSSAAFAVALSMRVPSVIGAVPAGAPVCNASICVYYTRQGRRGSTAVPRGSPARFSRDGLRRGSVVSQDLLHQLRERLHPVGLGEPAEAL